MDESYRNLWAAVLDQAIEDVRQYNGGFSMERAILWFESESNEIGSFLWVCSVLDLNPKPIKMFIRPEIRDRMSTSINNSPNEFSAL